MILIGAIELHLINDARTLVDPGGAFGLVPRRLWSHYFKPNDDHLIPMVQTCLFVRAGGKQIIIDTGMGSKLDEPQKAAWALKGENGLLKGLMQLGVKPADIDLVVNTHLHSDHCGGNTRWIAGTSEVEAVFPNAEYVVQRREYEDAMEPNERTRATYLPYNYQPLVESGQMRLLDGDTELAPGVFGVVTPGHTPGHMSVRFEGQKQHGLFLCDLATYAVHFERLAWMTAYDVEPLVTLETKRIWQQWALDHEAILIFPHDSIRPIGRLTRRNNGHLELMPIVESFVNEIAK